MGTWYSKDGKKYDTILEKQIADNAWDKQRNEQKEQIDLLNKQNELIKQNKIAEERRLEELKKIEKEKIENENELRLLNLSDKIGISKIYYDSFVEYLDSKFSGEESDKLYDLEDELEYIDEIIENIESKGLDYSQLENFKDCIIIPKENDSTKKIKEQIEKLKNEFNKSKVDDNDKPITKKWKYICVISAIISSVSFILSFFKDDTDLYFFLVMIGYFVAIFAFFKHFSQYRNKTYILKQNIKSLENSLKNAEEKLKNEKQVDVNKIKDKRNELRDKIEEHKKLVQQEFNEIISEFVQFRKEHYNSEIEKYLLDMGLKNDFDMYGIKYVIINNKNKINDGTIEDYIEYFSDYV